MKERIISVLSEQIVLLESMKGLAGEIEACAQIITSALRQGNKVLLCGNGGSAADAQHIAAELMGRFDMARSKGLVVIGLTGTAGKEMKELCKICLQVPSRKTPRIQEMHILIGHLICEPMEEFLC